MAFKGQLESTKEELGHLEGREQNRYWQIKLSKMRLLIGGEGMLYKIFWGMATFAMLFPLMFFAGYYRRKYGLAKSKRLKKDEACEFDVNAYKNFTDIYPGCFYSPFTKGYELELFKQCEITGPSLEIGIGDGYFSSLLFKARGQKLTYGADLIYETLKSAKKYNHCENYLVMDACEIPLPDNSLQTVIMNNLIHHLPDRVMVLDEVMRVLKKGGKFIFTDETLGWGTFTWEQLLLKKLKLGALAEKILKFKLKLFAQKLLVDEGYYDKKGEEGKFVVSRKINFVSKTSMYLSSLFEFLNLKQGQPTREEMLRWLKLFGLGQKLNGCLNDIIEYCWQKDRDLCAEEGYALEFFELEKIAGGILLETYLSADACYVCPKCKQALIVQDNAYSCNSCKLDFPLVEGIPVFISYQQKLKGFTSYLEKKSSEESKAYIT